MEVFSNFSHLCSLLLLLLWNYCVPRLPPEIFSKFLCSDCLLWITLSHFLLMLLFFFPTNTSKALIIFVWSSLPSSLLHTAACLFVFSFLWFLVSNVFILWKKEERYLILSHHNRVFMGLSLSMHALRRRSPVYHNFYSVSKETESWFCLSCPGCSES